MQRFVVKKEDVTGTCVKFSGYLKKKREKLGGWKKMWFVLQNQLLLSYSSKEEYEERLAPFKDVISLVPGTHVIPMQENKFTIETTSKALFIFRCDDPKTCSEWITILVESLKMITDKPNLLEKNLMDSHIPKPIFSDTSHLIVGKKFTTSAAKLPMAHGTASILKRGSLERIPEVVEGVQNFRLHDESGRKRRECQSIAVTRINRMFINVVGDAGHQYVAGAPLNTTQPSGKFPTNVPIEVVKVVGTPTSSRTVAIFRNMKKFIVRKKVACATDLNQNQASTPGAAIQVIEEQIQNITIDVEDEDDFLEDENDNREVGSWRNRDSYKNIQEEFEPLNLGILSPEEPPTEDPPPKTEEPVYAVVDKKTKRNPKSSPPPSPPPLKPTDDYEEIGVFLPAESTETIYEPVEIPKTSGKTFWRNLKQVNMDTFVDLTRRIRERTSPDGVAAMKEIKRKFGASRRSLKEKVLKMYSRSEEEAKNDEDLPRRRKRGSFFASFGGRVKKTSRTSSMCFEEFVPAKKFTFETKDASIPEEIHEKEQTVQNLVNQGPEEVPGSA